MEIIVNDDYRIAADERQYIVQVKQPKGDWRNITYHLTVKAAFNSIIKRELRASDIKVDIRNAQAVKDAIHRIDEITTDLIAAMDIVYEEGTEKKGVGN